MEQNLNSINFPEFHTESADSTKEEIEKSQQRMKEDLMWIAEFERMGMEKSMESLNREGTDKSIMKAVRLYMNVTDLYGQMYVQKDLTSRNK